MILLIDNYDSFVFNLARYFQRLGQTTLVLRNDACSAGEIRRLQPSAVVLSPGPCAPDQAGCSLDVVQKLHAEFPMLGVCLGHQVMGQAFGAQIVRAPYPMHGSADFIHHDDQRLFAGLPNPFPAGRYHSLAVDPETLPPSLRATAWTADGVLMALEHREFPVFGVQFHPESILTEVGFELLARFLALSGVTPATVPSHASEHAQPAPAAPAPASPLTF